MFSCLVLGTGPGSSASVKFWSGQAEVLFIRLQAGSSGPASEPNGPAEPPQISGSGLQQVLPILSDPDVQLQNQNLGPDRLLVQLEPNLAATRTGSGRRTLQVLSSDQPVRVETTRRPREHRTSKARERIPEDKPDGSDRTRPVGSELLLRHKLRLLQ